MRLYSVFINEDNIICILGTLLSPSPPPFPIVTFPNCIFFPGDFVNMASEH